MVYTKYDFSDGEDICMLESFTERMITDCVKSKLRKNSEYGLVRFAMKSEILCDILLPLINYPYIYKTEQGKYLRKPDRDMVNKWLASNSIVLPLKPTVPTTFE